MQIHPFKQFRLDNKLTQKQLAPMLNLSIPSICRIENHRQAVTIVVAEQAERTLGISRFALLYPLDHYTKNKSKINIIKNFIRHPFSGGKSI